MSLAFPYSASRSVIDCNMAQVARRLFTTSACRQASAAEASAEIFERFGNRKPVSVRKQVLDANQLQLLSITLNRTPTSNNPPPEGTPVPPGYHLAYFTPSIVESELGLDGTDRTVNPLSPYTRRMWAGGELTWAQDVNALLRVGQEVRETTKLLSAEPKKLKNGGEMLVVGVEKTFENNKGIALVDKRNWVFQKEIAPEAPLTPHAKPEEKALPSGEHTRDFCQSDVTLFRFSALTFNGHKIHFSPEWCRQVEGHRTCVVHGPLNLINMLDLWRDAAKSGGSEAAPKSITYRAMSPLYMGEPYRILLSQGEQGSGWSADIWDSYGKQSMKGTIKE
jgi:hydroxyacyl-ACP dehydratase HTD2-like protein with hotdog domain